MIQILKADKERPAAELAIPSTVIKVNQNNIERPREGKVPFAEIEKLFIQGLEQ